MMNQMRSVPAETWIMLVAIIFLAVIAVIAVTPSRHAGSSAKPAVLTGPLTSGPATGMVAPSTAAVLPQNRTVAQLQPLQPRPLFRYSGVVDQFVNRDPGGWGQVHVLVNDGAGLIQDVSLAPEWYLSFQGCVVRRGLHVEGEGFHFDGLNEGGVIYAKNLVVGGVRCRLRTVDGLALWTDQLR
jgi:hypothetical protein